MESRDDLTLKDIEFLVWRVRQFVDDVAPKANIFTASAKEQAVIPYAQRVIDKLTTMADGQGGLRPFNPLDMNLPGWPEKET